MLLWQNYPNILLPILTLQNINHAIHSLMIHYFSAKSYPFRIEFHSDGYEYSAAANDEGTGNNPGFKLRYFQTTC